MGIFDMGVRIQETSRPATERRVKLKYAPLWLFLAALAIRLLIVVATRFDGLYGQDAFAYFDCARDILSIRAMQVPCDDFHWPLGYPLLAALFMLGTHAAPLGAQLASMVTGAAIAPLAYWMALAAAPATARDQENMAVAAGLIAASCGQLILSSIVVMSDAPGLFWATASACALLQWERSASNTGLHRLGLAMAAAALALAIITRWIYAGSLLPFGIFAIIAARRKLRDARAAIATSVKPLWSVEYLSYVFAAFVFSCILVAQLYLNALSPAPVLHHGWLINWNLLGAWRTSFDNPDGHFNYRVPPLIYYGAPLFHPLYVSPLLTGCALLGAWRLRRSPALIVLGGWIVTLYLYLVGIPYENGRFGLAFFSPVAVLAGAGLFQLAPARAGSWPRWTLLTASLAISAAFTYRSYSSFHSVTEQQFSAIDYLRSRIPPDATVVTFGLSISLEHYTHFTVVDLSMHSPDSLRPIVCSASTAYLYIDRSNIESQWAGRAPEANYRWIRDSIGVRQLGSQGNWILYRVLPCSLGRRGAN
jgi:hypothetical protein